VSILLHILAGAAAFAAVFVSRGWPGWSVPGQAAFALTLLVTAANAVVWLGQALLRHVRASAPRPPSAAALFGEQLAEVTSVPALTAALLALAESPLAARLAALWIRDPTGGASWQAASPGEDPPTAADLLLFAALETGPHLLTRRALAQGALPAHRAQAEALFDRVGADVLLALVARSEDERAAAARGLCGIVAIGAGRPGTELDDETLELCERLRAHAAAALVHVFLHERASALERALERKVAARAAELARTAEGLEKTREQLVQSQKMSLLGVLTSGVADDLATAVARATAAVPHLVGHVATLQGSLDLLRDAAAPAARAQILPREQTSRLAHIRGDVVAILDAIAEGGRRAAAIAADLGQFARADAGERTLYDLHGCLESTLNLLAHELRGGRVQIVRDFDPALPRVECAPGAIRQLFMNLLLNAVQATRGQGSIMLRTRRVAPDRVELYVADDGAGIGPEHLPRVFEPFFTTEPSRKGLGLAVCYGIVEGHGGRIDVTSSPGQGAGFRVVLPVAGRHRRDQSSTAGEASNT
jgi:signal transduction histidine kinase